MLAVGYQMKQAINICCDTLIAGGGIAGLVTALELLEQNQQVCLIDRDTKERLGGLARWAFGGMALSGTNEQRRSNIPDNDKLLLKDWLRFGLFDDKESSNEVSGQKLRSDKESETYWPQLWAKEYATFNNAKVYLWLKKLGLNFLPAVNWVERGLYGNGNTVPRYHVISGTGWHLIETLISKLQPFIKNQQLVIYHQHKVESVKTLKGITTGAMILNELTQEQLLINAENIVIACGGINGSTAKVKENWCKAWGDVPKKMLNGANPISDGKLHEELDGLGAKITHVENMWNYAAGIPHPQAEFKGHGLSLIPCKSALWINHLGKRIGPLPLVTGFDTNYLCQQVTSQEKPWTWQILNWRIAVKEFAISGSAHNPSIKNKNSWQLLMELLFGNQSLVKQMAQESADFIVADSIEGLVDEMNKLTDRAYIKSTSLKQEIENYDVQINPSKHFENDDQLRRIHQARQWLPDRLRTCKPKAILAKNIKTKSEKLIAIKVQFISRKSLGGVQTNLQSQVLGKDGSIIKGLYCVGEAAGFGGGGASGKRSLEGTFLSGCILTARNAATEILNKEAKLPSTATSY